MPLYEYKCFACGAVKSLTRTIRDRDDDVWCEECRPKVGKRPMVRQLSAPSFKIEGFSEKNGYSSTEA